MPPLSPVSEGCDEPARGRSTTKKALLIGISYHTGRESQGSFDELPTSIPNVRAFETFLRESRGYTDITVMTDEAGVEARYQPTQQNLEHEIRAFGRGVQPGDRRVFYFAGHSGQMPCKTGSEEDDMDEALVALYGGRIRDNTLRDLLVEGLPKGSALTAIFDSCTSGTMLDLEHYKCNNVYRPWVNKGDRRTCTLQNRVVRKDGKDTHSPPPSRPGSTNRKGSIEANVPFHSLIQLMMGTCPESPNEKSDKHFGQRTASPERRFECEGWCRDTIPSKAALEHPDVISISSSNDGQTSWDANTKNGGCISMTTHIINIIEDHPEITTSDFMTRLNHEMHSFTLKMHGRVQRESRARRKGDGKNMDSEGVNPEGEFKGEMDNFQELQLGSITPVDMARPFIL